MPRVFLCLAPIAKKNYHYSMAYLMESKKEAERLLNKSDHTSSREQLLLTGLKPGMLAIDAGGGAGFVTKIMADILGSEGRVILIDQSLDRLKAAKAYNPNRKNIGYLCSPLEAIELEDNASDFVFCRFVFEYIKDPKQALSELIRITKPGGKIVVGDLDYNVMSHYPLKSHLESQLLELIGELQKMELWDPYAGRKLFHYFREASLENIKVHMLPHHLIYGDSDKRDYDNWRSKLDQMSTLIDQGVLNISFDFDSFKEGFLEFFQSPDRFSYSPLFLVEGIKPIAKI